MKIKWKKMLLLLVLLLLLVRISSNLYRIYPLFQYKDAFKAYLKDNFIPINEDAENNYAEILDIDDDVKFILLGEVHGVATNAFIELDLMKYLV